MVSTLARLWMHSSRDLARMHIIKDMSIERLTYTLSIFLDSIISDIRECQNGCADQEWIKPCFEKIGRLANGVRQIINPSLGNSRVIVNPISFNIDKGKIFAAKMA